MVLVPLFDLTLLGELAAGGGGTSRGSMQARAFEEAVAVARCNAQLEGAAVAIDQERHLDAGLAERPDVAEQARKLPHFRPGDGEHDVSGAQLGALRRPAGGDPDDDDPVLDLAGVEPEPRPRRAIAPPIGEEVVEN